MKAVRSLLLALFVFGITIPPAFAGTETKNVAPAPAEMLDPPRFEFAVQSAYLMCFLNNPHAYEIAAEFLTGRVRWGVIQNEESWLRGYQQFYLSAVIEPIVRGPENHYFGFSFGLRYNFVRPGSRFIPYVSGGVGLGWIDSNAAIGGTQGQDFTFNVLSAVGIAYQINERWKIDLGAQYEHLSNGGQTSPNPSLNLIGPQLSVSYSF